MFKKILYSLTILAMLFAAFGVMTPGGVKPALALGDAIPDDTRGPAATGFLADTWGDGEPWNDSYYFAAINMPVAPVVAGDPIGCYIGLFTKWVRVPAAVVGVTGVAVASTLHIHAAPVVPDALVIAAYVANADGTLGTRLGCDDSTADGVLDLVVQVPAGTVVDVLVANNALYAVPVGAAGELWIMRGDDPSGGFIVSGLDGGASPDTAYIYNSTLAAPAGLPQSEFLGFVGPTYRRMVADADGNAWFPRGIPAGTGYTVGVSHGPGSILPYAYVFGAQTVPGFMAFVIPVAPFVADLSLAAGTPIKVTGVAFVVGDAHAIRVIPSNGSLIDTMNLGAQVGAVLINITPGLWDAALTDDNAPGADYYLVQLNTNAIVGGVYPLDFRANIITPALVRMCSPAYNGPNGGGFEYALIGTNPAGPLGRVWLDYSNGAGLGCPINFAGGLMYLTAGLNYGNIALLGELTDHAVHIAGYDWEYLLVPPNDPWNFSAGIVTPAYTALFGAWYDTNGNGRRDISEIDANGDGLLDLSEDVGAGTTCNGIFEAAELAAGDADIFGDQGEDLNCNGVRDLVASSESTFRSTATTSAMDYATGVSSVAMTRGNWVDANGNILMAIDAPDNTQVSCLDTNGDGLYNDLGGPNGAGDDDDAGGTSNPDTATGYEWWDGIVPCDNLQSGAGVETNLANDFDTTAFSLATPAVGRYFHWRWLQNGPALQGVRARAVTSSIFAVSPTDTPMNGHWAWSWVQALYELGYTTGIGAGAYGPDQTMTRAQMAVFLSRMLSDNSSIPAAGAGVGGVFTDVPAAYWAGGAIEQLEDLGITSGIGGGLYGPDAPVTRAEMAKFIQLTFRAARMYGWNGCDLTVPANGECVWTLADPDLWDPSQNVLAPGNTFKDVPAGHWANLWIEEMWFDGLTSGCTYEQNNWFFCPEDNVTRGQMAKFILTALQTDAATQAFWPVLAPER